MAVVAIAVLLRRVQDLHRDGPSLLNTSQFVLRYCVPLTIKGPSYEVSCLHDLEQVSMRKLPQSCSPVTVRIVSEAWLKGCLWAAIHLNKFKAKEHAK